MKKLIFAIAAIAVMASCSNEDIDATSASLSSKGEGVSFSSSSILTKAYDTTWEAGDQIGIYKDGTFSYSNVNYGVETGGTSVEFVAPSAGYIDFASDEANADFYAYYPYTANMSGSVYPVDVRDQSDLTAIDLLVSSKVENVAYSEDPAVSFTFSHKLSQIVVNFTAGENVATIDGLTASIGDLYTTAKYDVKESAFVADSFGDLGELSFDMPQGEASKLATETIEAAIAEVEAAIEPITAALEEIASHLPEGVTNEYTEIIEELLAEAEAALEEALLSATVYGDLTDVEAAIAEFEASIETIKGYLVEAAEAIETIDGYAYTLEYALGLYYTFAVVLDDAEDIYNALVNISDAMDALFANDSDYQDALAAYDEAYAANEAASGWDKISTAATLLSASYTLATAEAAIMDDIDTENPANDYEGAYVAALAALEATDFYESSEYANYVSYATSPYTIDLAIAFLALGVETAESNVISFDLSDYIDIENLIGIDLSEYGIDLSDYLDLSQYSAEDVETMIEVIETLREVLAYGSEIIVEADAALTDMSGVIECLETYLDLITDYQNTLTVTSLTDNKGIIIPQTFGEGEVAFYFSSPLYGDFSVVIPNNADEGVAFVGGMIYTYNITVSIPTPEEPEPEAEVEEVVVSQIATKSNTIVAWDSQDAVDL